MKILKNTLILILSIIVCSLSFRVVAEGTWTALAHTAPGGVETMLLLPDGSVMAQHNGTSAGWYKLTPDSSGHYVNGTWSNLSSMSYTRLYYASQVLPDGRVFLAGAEYGTGTTNAEIYHPSGDYWTQVTIPSGIINKNNTVAKNNQNSGGFTDCGSIVVSGGKVLVFPNAPAVYGNTTTYDPVANTWSTAQLLRGGNEDEASVVKLPDDSILVVDSGTTSAERYIPSSNSWIYDQSCPVALYDSYGTEEGPAFLLPNGNAFFIGSTTNTAIYIPSGNTTPGTWVTGPSLGGLGAPDAPGAMMSNGKILCVLSPTPYQSGTNKIVFTKPSYFYEYDYTVGSVGSFTQIHAPGGGYTRNETTFNDRMLDLPDGTVLFTDGGKQLYVYQPAGSALTAGKPHIHGVHWNNDGSLHLTGTLFNGISRGAGYGDNAQMDSNYPLVRFTDSNGNVYYGRSHDWSSTSIATGSQEMAVDATLPQGVLDAPGSFSLQVVANGNVSTPVSFYAPVWVDFSYSSPFGIYLGFYNFPYNNMADGVNAVASGGTIAIKTSHTSATMTISKPMTIVSVNGPSTIGH